MIKPLTLLFFALMAGSLSAQTQFIDSTFGANGQRQFGFAGSGQDAAAALLLPDGKILMGGYSSQNAINQFTIVRLTAAGAIDASFGNAGQAQVNTGVKSEFIHALALTADGKILAAGFTTDADDKKDFALARFTAAGVPDLGFGTDGVVVTDINGRDDEAHSMVVMPDGKILLAGWEGGATSNTVGMVRYLANGTPDATFGTNGVQFFSLGSKNEEWVQMGLTATGSVLISSTIIANSRRTPVVARLQGNGALDSTFGVNGIARPAIAGVNLSSLHMVTGPDDRIHLAGIYNPTSNQEDFSLVQLLPNGSPDFSFGDSGYVFFNVTPGSRDLLTAFTRQADGKLVISGRSIGTSQTDFVFVRFLPDGTLDNGFGTNGIITFRRNLSQTAKALLPQPDGKLVALGSISGSGIKMWALRLKSSLSVGIDPERAAFAAGLRLYPNPVADRFVLTYALAKPGPVSVWLTDIAGRQVAMWMNNEVQPATEHEFTGEFPANLPRGMYVLHVSGPHGHTSLRLSH